MVIHNEEADYTREETESIVNILYSTSKRSDI